MDVEEKLLGYTGSVSWCFVCLFKIILFGEWVVDFKSASTLDHNSCLKMSVREEWVGSASRFWGDSWMQLVTVPWTKADSGQGMLLLSFHLLSDQTSRVTFLPPTPPPPPQVVKNCFLGKINSSGHLDCNIILCRCVFFMKTASCSVKQIHLGTE